MVTRFDAQRLCAIAVATLLLCGCRSASVKSSSGVNRVPYASGGSIARPYGQPQQPYDDDYPLNQSPSPQPDPPAILPAPGFSQPTEPPVPPTPSAKKSRWNLVPSGLKLPSTMRSNGDVHQTGVKSDWGLSRKIAKQGSATKPADVNSHGLTEETVGSRNSGAATGLLFSPSRPVDSSVSETPILPPPTFSEANEGRSSIATKIATAPRSGMNNFSPDNNRGFRTTPVPSLDPVARPLASQGQSAASTEEEMPLLLPPGN